MPADVSMRRLILTCAIVCVGTACSGIPQGEVEFGTGRQFIPNVADSLGDVGRGNAIAVNADGVPYVSYVGFPEEPEEGEIPVTRPIGSPFLPGVLIASVNGEGIWTRGAAAMAREAPAGVTIPFGPDTAEEVVTSVERMQPDSASGTDIAVDGSGGLHTVWAGGGEVWYATGTTSFTAEQVARGLASVGRPAVTVDGDDNVLVAFSRATASGAEVVVARKDGDAWRTEVVAEGAEPVRVEIGTVEAGPVVVYPDGDGVGASLNDGENAWVAFPVESGVTGMGLSLASGSDGTLWAAYYGGDGAVHVANSTDGGSWSTSQVASVNEPQSGAGASEPTTGVAVDDEGTVFVTWQDAEEGVKVASGDGETFESIETRGTEGGRYPSIGVAPDGSRVYLAWYAAEQQDLLVGIVDDAQGLVIAEPSPTPEATVPAPGPDAGCEPSGTELTIVATGSTFDQSCLAVEAATPFSVTLENQDPVPHDFSIYPSASEVTEDAALIYSFDDPQPGSGSITYPVDPIEEPGDYYFQCDFHPTTMTGTFVVAEAGGGGGGA
jgi:plastocyanin